MAQEISYQADLDLYLCAVEVLDNTCFSSDTLYLGETKTDTLTTEVTHTITIGEYQKGVDPVDILFGSWIRCAQALTPGGENGSWGGCAWAGVDVAALFAGKAPRPIADAVRAADAAARTEIGFVDALKGLRALPLADDVVARLGYRVMDESVEVCTRSSRRVATLAATAAGGCGGLIRYNSDDLSRMAYQFRGESGFFGADHNVAVARVPGWNDPKAGDLVVASSGFSGHSGTVILNMLKAKKIDPREITGLYTERCSRAGAVLLSWPVPSRREHPSHGRFPISTASKAAKQLLAKYAKQAGGGRLARSSADLQQQEEGRTHE